MTINEVRTKYFEHCKKYGHTIIPSAGITPENDPTTLFTGSGMQPLIPYLLGQDHPEGVRLANSQKCFRAEDIDEVGDNRHTTFFEMLGNWSLGDYFKEKQLEMFFTFLTDEVGLDPNKIYTTCFIGDKENDIPRDTESAGLWQELFEGKGIHAEIVEIGSEEDGGKKGMGDGHIFYYDATKNWWSRAGVPGNMPAGEPGGPDSEVFYDFGGKHDTAYGKYCHPNCDCGRFIELGNSVFMEYIKTDLPAPKPDLYFTYAILCDDDSIYIGQTNNLQRRWNEHCEGDASEHTLKHKPKKLIHYEEFQTREEAVGREQKLKTGFGRKWIKRELNAGRLRQAGAFKKLEQKNVDFGGGLERITAAANHNADVFTINIFKGTIAELETVTDARYSDEKNKRAFRIIADHLRGAIFMMVDGIVPSNKDQGYVLRRILRRAIFYADVLKIPEGALATLSMDLVEMYKQAYPSVGEKVEEILAEIAKEGTQFRKTLAKGLREFDKIITKNETISGKDAFILFTTYGFPLELTQELAQKKNINVDLAVFQKEFKKHQEISKTASAGKFKGGLAEHSEKTTALHTATHLMLAGLRKYVGKDVHQRGSNITQERTRFDFTCDHKVERDVLDQVEKYVNAAIEADCPVMIEEMTKGEALKAGVEGSFWEKYPDRVIVYTIGDDDCGDVYSHELCGGPHVKNTGDIKGTFKILKEKSSSAGVRRIKAVLEE